MDSLQYRRDVERFLDTLSSEALAYLFPGAEREEIEDAFGLGESPQPNYYSYQTPDVWSRGNGGTTSFLQAYIVEPRKQKPEKKYSTDFGNGEVDYLSQVLSDVSRGVDVTDDSYPELSPQIFGLLKSLGQIAQSRGKSLVQALTDATKVYAKSLEEAGDLRRLHIDKYGKITLEGIKDKGIEDVEIKLKPMQKAFYILYLRHPEGINFKDIGDYEDELKPIVATLSHRGENADREKRLKEMCDPFDSKRRNSYSTSIYSAFANVMTDALASEYSIVGPDKTTKGRGETRSIPIPRSYVTDEFVLRYE
jgi:hypothetical protein